ncbi:MAG TPA: cupin domain-containing protein [Ramlibacter sp.]|nr:cupin domain-containing protein [Ramlibacter sp.]
MHHDPRALDPQELQPAPIPDEWVIAGQPQARALELGRSPDGTCTAAHWDCTAGTFHWFFFNEEIVHILDGEVLVRSADGQERLLRAGDVAVLPANQWMVWRVDRYVRKLAYCRFPVPRPFGKLVRGVQKARTWLGLKQLPAVTAS